MDEEKNFFITNSIIANKALEIANDIKHLEDQMDQIYKINLYLLRRYKDDLLKEFDIKISQEMLNDPWVKLFESIFDDKLDLNDDSILLTLITNKISEQMKKEMPEPWYCYGLSSSKKSEN